VHQAEGWLHQPEAQQELKEWPAGYEREDLLLRSGPRVPFRCYSCSMNTSTLPARTAFMRTSWSRSLWSA
jgi:hypothetical protein